MTQIPSLAATEASPLERPTPERHGAPLLVAMLGFFVVALDAQIVNVALPDIGTGLGGGLSGLQWVVTSYTLTFSSLLLFAGTVADRIGSRRTYAIGMTVFVAASVLCGLAPSLEVLVGARVAQGVGAALVTPTSLALLRAAYTDAAMRARAVAYWALGGSVAAAAGPVLGGVLTQLDWRVIFLVNVPVGVLAGVLLARTTETERQDQRFDVVGQVTAVMALAGLTFGLIEGGSRGFGDGPVVLALAVSAVAAAAFVVAQVRGAHPMVPLDLFGSRTVTSALVTAFVTMAAFYSVVFVQSLYFQDQRGASPLQTGLLFLPMTALVAILNPVAATMAARLGPRVPIVTGQALMVLGLVGLSTSPTDMPVWAVAALMVPVGVGGSLTVPPLTSLLLEAVPARRTGTASGVLNTARQVGGSIGVASSGAVIAHAAGFTPGMRSSLLAIAALVLVTTVVGVLTPTTRQEAT